MHIELRHEKLDNPYTTECLNCGINVWSDYLYDQDMDNDNALCPRCVTQHDNEEINND